MKTFNLHTHTCHSDGSQEPRKYIEEALKQDFEVLGFSDHSPLPFQNNFAIKDDGPALQEYCDSILSLKKEFAPESNASGKLGIFLGLELEYVPGITHPISFYRDKFPFDYIIGSVHLVKNEWNELWFIDGPKKEIYDEGLKTLFGNDIRKAVTAYYRQFQEMVTTARPEIIGHMDKIKMHNRGRFFSEDEPWYISLTNETLDLIKQTGGIVEVNTRGIYKKRSDTQFPGPEILKKIFRMNIPITLSSDAHKPEELSLCFKESGELLKSIGFRSLVARKGNGWEEYPF